MFRREFLAAPALLQRRKPNVVVMLADNWAWPHASACGDPVVQTPVFDRIAREGVLFENAFAPNPSCAPSRSGLLTGQITHRLRDAANLYGPLDPAFPTYVSSLRGAGYHVGFSGKGWGPGPMPQGNPAGEPFPDFERFLSARGGTQPLCYWLGSRNPHVPWTEGTATRSRLRADQLRIPAHLPDHADVRADMLDYYCEVQAFDEECGRVVAALEAAGELDNTLLIMTSDNGWQLPRGLANCYDLGVRIPMAIRWPAQFRAGSRRGDFVALMDLAPTILEAAGAAALPFTDGASLFSKSRRDHMFVERERHANVRRGDLSYPVRGIRTRDHLYLRNFEPDRWPAGDPQLYWAVGPYGDIDDSRSKRLLMAEKPQPFFDLCMGKRPVEELYDLRSDPGQIRNLAGDRRHAAIQTTLAARVAQWMEGTADPRAKGPTDFWDRVPYTGGRARTQPAAGTATP